MSQNDTQKDKIREIIVDFRDEALVITGKWKGQQYGSFYYDADYINKQLFKGKPSSVLVNKTTKQILFQRNPAKPKDDMKRSKKDGDITVAAQCQMYSKVLQNRQQFQNGLVSILDILNFVSEIVKEFVDLNFEPGTNLIYLVEHEQFKPQKGVDNEDEPLFEQFQGALSTAFTINPKQIKPLKSKLMLALDLGTGFYLGTITNVQGCYDIKKEGFYVGQDDAYTPQQEEGKVESTVYINPDFNTDKIPQLLCRQKYGDLQAENEILANTAIFPSQRTENWGVFRFYKRFLYQDIDQNPQNNAQATKNKQKVNSNETKFNVVIDEQELSSELYYILNQKKENQTRQIVVGILHLFIILLIHMKRALELKYQKPVADMFDVVRFSMPKKANKSHERFMQCALRAGLGLPYNFTLESTMEPEAAFSYIAKLDTIDNVSATKINEALVADGGDGTFDFLYAKKIEVDNECVDDEEKRLTKTSLWQEKYSSAETIGGSNIRNALVDCVLPFFGNNMYDHNTLSLAQKMYGKIQDLMKISPSIIDNPVDCTEAISPYKDQIIEHIKLNKDIFMICKKETPNVPITSDEYDTVKDSLYQSIRQRKPDAANDLVERMYQKEIAGKVQVFLSKTTVQKVDAVMNKIAATFEQSCVETQKMLTVEKQQERRVFKKDGAKDQNEYHCAVLAVGGLAKNLVIQNKFSKKINQLNLISDIKFCLLFPPKPQSAIVDGIPVQRAEISTRDFNVKAPHYLYFTYTKTNQKITPKHLVTISGAITTTMAPQFTTGQVRNTAEEILGQNKDMHPNSNKRLQDITMNVNTPYTFNFAISNYPLPPFLNIQDEEIKNKICITKSFQVEVPLANVPKELGLNEYVRAFKCEIHMVFDHKRYHSKPFIQIYATQDKKKFLVQEMNDELWEWFESADVPDVEFTYRIDEKVEGKKK